MASEQIININYLASNIEPSGVTVTSELAECPTSISAVPETEHRGEPETHAAFSKTAAEGLRPESVSVSAGLGESGQDAAREGQDSQGKSREEEENERTDRELSETIEKLDSVLLEAGEREGQMEGDRTNVHRTEQVSASIEQTIESGGETTVQVPAEETTVQVPAEETIVQMSGGETTVQMPAEETISQVSGGETTDQLSVGETTGQVPAEETTVQVSGGETTGQVPAEETSAQVSGGETTAQVSGGETTAQVSGGETTAQVSGGETTGQVSGGENTAQVSGGEITGQILTEENIPQVPKGELPVQMPAAEGPAQVPAEETTVHVSVSKASINEAEREATESVSQSTVQVSEETRPPVASEVTNKSASQETGLQVTTQEDVSPKAVEGTGTDARENVTTLMTKAGEVWIDTLVQNIVTEVTAKGTIAGEALTDCQPHIPKDSADSGSDPTEEGGHSCTATTTITSHKQLTLEETGAAVAVTDIQAQVSCENIDITVQVVCEEGEVTGSPGQLEKTGRQQVGLSSTEGVPASLTEQETGTQVKVSGEEALREVTPDLVAVPSREGTADPGHPVACREKEWPPLICTGSEVRADTAEQRGTEQGKEPCPGVPDMKDREMVEDGVTLTPETPIEREIRLAMEREMSLRQERGINVSIGEPELVEVRRKTVLAEPAALPGKERQLAGAQMQREIQLETQREQDLVDQGKLMGTYDRGPQQELQERKMIFESMTTEPSDSPFKRRQSEVRKSESFESLVEVDAPSNHVTPATPAAGVKKGPSYAEANGSNIIIIEHASIFRRPTPGNVYSAAPADLRRTAPAEPRRSVPTDLRVTRSSSGSIPVPNSESPVAAPSSPFQVVFSPSSRSLLEREIEEVQERERELRRQRTSIYGRDNTAENSQRARDNRDDIQSGVYQPERPNWRKLEVKWPPNKSMNVNGQQDQACDSPRTRRQRSALIQSWESGNPNPADDN